MNDKRDVKPGQSINRRDFLKLGGLAGAASILAGCGGTAAEPTKVPSPVWPPPGATQAVSQPTQAVLQPTPTAAQSAGEIALRIAHISDMHVGPENPGTKGFTRALKNVKERSPGVDLVLNTGDCVGDSMRATKDQTRAQWDAFKGVVKAEVSLPIHHAIGNHDVWGWGLPADERKRLRSDPLFGKGFALQELGIPDRYYSFEMAGWRFLVLDSIHVPEFDIGHAYTGKLDDEQFSWLEQQLQATPPSTPVCVVSHIPILTACELLDGPNESTGNWVVPGAWVHIDARRLWSLFWQHPNVKLCLSGHTHQVEDLRYHGVKYLTDGAICANWWNASQPAYMDFPPGYVVVNLYTDGSSESEFVAY